MGVLVVMSIHSAHATNLGCVSTAFNALSPNDKVCVSVFEDPQVPGIVCYISQARKGGWGQQFGLNEDPSNFSVACRQIGSIDVDLSKLSEDAALYPDFLSEVAAGDLRLRFFVPMRSEPMQLIMRQPMPKGRPALARRIQFQTFRGPSSGRF